MKFQNIKKSELKHFTDADGKKKTAFFPKKDDKAKVKTLTRKGK